MSELWITLALLLLAGLGVGLLEKLIREPLLGAGLVLGATVLHAAVGDIPRLTFGGLSVGPVDIVFALVTVAGVARLLRLRRFTLRSRLLIVLCLLVLSSLLRGFPLYEAVAITEFKPFLRLFGAAVYFMTVRPEPLLLEKMGRLFMGAALALVALISLRWVAALGGFSLGLLAPTHASARYALRAVGGPISLTIGQAFLVALSAGAAETGGRARRVLPVLFGAFVILLNRRSVWVAVLAGLLVFLLHNRTVSRRAAPLLIGAAVVASVVLVNLPGTETAESGVAASATDTGTLVGRIEGWEELLEEGPEGLEWVVGRPLGAGFERVRNEHEVDSNPHSFYVELLLRAGVLGVLSLLVLYASAARALRRAAGNRAEFLPRSSLLVLLVTQAIFFITWTAGLEQGIILGLGCATLFKSAAKSGPPATARRLVAGTDRVEA